MKKEVISKYTDDFLKGSVTVYNYNPTQTKDYLIYCQIAGIQKIGDAYFNELNNFPNYMINYTTHGKGYFKINGIETIVEEGDLIFAQNSNHHILKKLPNQDWTFSFIHIFESAIVSNIYQEFVNKYGFVVKGVKREFVTPYIQKIIKLLREKQTDYELKISSLVYEMLLNIVENASADTEEKIDISISNVVSYIKNNFDKKITIKDILSHTTYSKNHMERLFKEKMHMTMKDYLYSLRLRRAQELLITTDLTLKEIAEATGLSEYRALHYLFTHNIGCTPNEFRTNQRALEKKQND